MQEPSVRNSRLAIAGGIAAVLLVGGGGFLLGRISLPPPPVRSAPPAAAAPVLPVPDRVHILDRGDILAAATKAADSLASGGAPAPDLKDLPGRRFSLALPLGCGGPAG
jgi:hypothetical protein